MSRLPHPPRSLAALGLALVSAGAAAAPAVGWRGDGRGVFPGARPPVSWSLATGRNVAWSRPLAAGGNASPIVVGTRVFLTAEPTRLLAFDLADGHLAWERSPSMVDALPPEERAAAFARLAAAREAQAELPAATAALNLLKRAARRRTAGEDPGAKLAAATERASQLQRALDLAADVLPQPTGDLIGHASATPVSDGRRVYAVFAQGLVVAYDLDGTLAWARRVGPPSRSMRGYHQGHAASPLLAGGRLVVGFGPLQGLDPETGRTAWTGPEYRDFGTPAVVSVGGVDAVATPDGTLVRASDGRRLAGPDAQLLYVGPVAAEGTLFYAGALTEDEMRDQGGGPASAWSLGGPAPRRLWATRLAADRVYATPLLHEGRLWVVNARRELRILDASTGKILHRTQLGKGDPQPFASPVAAAGRVYVSFEDGSTHVLRAGGQFEVLATNDLEPGHASPFPVGDALVVRTDAHLFLLRESPSAAPQGVAGE
jgi:outer membrane protein assembly factor BamB